MVEISDKQVDFSGDYDSIFSTAAGQNIETRAMIRLSRIDNKFKLTNGSFEWGEITLSIKKDLYLPAKSEK